jgi:acyl dehydratase
MENLSSVNLLSNKYTVSQDEINSFAEVSGGMGAIHTDPVYAKNTFFKKTLVHGLYLLALIEKEAAIQFKEIYRIGTIEVTYFKPVVVDQEFQIKFIQDYGNKWSILVLSGEETMIAGTVLLD